MSGSSRFQVTSPAWIIHAMTMLSLSSEVSGNAELQASRLVEPEIEKIVRMASRIAVRGMSRIEA